MELKEQKCALKVTHVYEARYVSYPIADATTFGLRFIADLCA